jgi:hypothetical protein
LAAPLSDAANSNEPAWRGEVRALAQKHFKNPAWGYSHSTRDYELARQLAAADHVPLDDDVLFAASYLHDIAMFQPWEVQSKDHSDVGATAIDNILTKSNFPIEKIDAVRNAIRTHMYYRKPVGPEATYLHDADALDWLGAIGVARVIALTDSNGGSPNVPDEVALIEHNLKDVPPHVVSPAGRLSIGARSAKVVEYLKSLRSETDDFHSL